MDASLNSWNRRIDQVSQSFAACTQDLSPTALNFKPSPDTWSLAQIMDHLMVINTTYFPVLEALHAGSYRPPFLARFAWLARFFGKMVLKLVGPDQGKAIKTFPIWEPAASALPANLPRAFALHQEELKAQFKAALSLLPANPIIASPASRKIFYPLQTAFETIVSHEERHLLQAQRLMEQIPDRPLLA